MTFEEAEAKFRQLQARVQRGESISRAEYEEEVGKLAVQDRNGTLWEINPRTGKWMYFDGAEWVSGAPPGHDTSTVIPVPKEIATAKDAPPTVPPPSAPARPSTPPTEPPPFVRAEPKTKPVARAKTPAPPLATDKPGERPARSSPLGGRNREWVPLAIGAVVLLFCAVMLFVTAQFVLPIVSPKPTPTRTLAAQRPTTVLPPATTMPTSTPVPPTPAPVIAKVTAATLNIRAEPNSKSARVGTLRKDNQVTFLAQTKGEKIEEDDTWYLINLPNTTQQGWVFFGKNFQIVSGDPKTLPPPKP
jgi:hypothetical protein